MNLNNIIGEEKLKISNPSTKTKIKSLKLSLCKIINALKKGNVLKIKF